MTLLVKAVTFVEDGAVLVEFADTSTDYRKNGLAINHVVFCPADEYEDEIDAVLEKARALLESVQIDLRRSDPLEVDTPEDDDEEDDD